VAKLGTAAWRKNVSDAAIARGNTIAGKPVLAAEKRIMLDIVQQDISQGKSKDPGACAAARCILRQFANAISARVHLGRTYIEFKDFWLRLKTPDSLRSEIIAFDRGGAFEPGHHELAPLCPSERKKYTGRRQGSNEEDVKKKRKRKHIARAYRIPNVRARGANR
jgi:hypothetical protein